MVALVIPTGSDHLDAMFSDLLWGNPLFAFAVVGLPVVFLGLCIWMRIRGATSRAYEAQFILFGTVGGWALAYCLSPSGLGAVCLLFLLILTPACLISSVLLQIRGKRDRFESAAMIGGYVVAAVLAGLFALA